jgi:Zn-dependent protease with chaperone function
MRIRHAPPDASQLIRLQAAAARRPMVYRAGLVALALLGDFILTFVQVLPWALPIVIGALLFNSPLFHWLAAFAIILLIWLFRPNFRSSGRALTRSEAPALFDAITDLKQKLDMRGTVDVHIDGSFNASAAETRGLFGVLGTRRVLTLGAPLLHMLSRDQLLAIVAHEFGHFSRRHGRLGHWLYRAHAGWLDHADYVDASSSVLDRAAAAFAQRFVPMFSVRALVHSRQCEYEADADAAEVVGSKQFASALTKVALVSRWMRQALPRLLIEWRAVDADAPRDFHDRVARALARTEQIIVEQCIAAELALPTDWIDTHPTLQERLAALRSETDDISVREDECAGSALLHPIWPEILAEFNANWQKENAAEWRCEHLRHKHQTAALLKASDAEAATWMPEQRLMRARALRAADPLRGLSELRALDVQHGDRHDVSFAFAAALLAECDAQGTSPMEELAKRDATYRVPAYQRLARYWQEVGDAKQSERWLGRLQIAGQKRFDAINAFLTRLEEGDLISREPDPLLWKVLLGALEFDSDVAGAWLVEGDAPLATNESRSGATLPVVVLVVAIDPSAMEDGVVSRYQDQMAALLASNAEPVIRTHYSTEPLAPEFAHFLDSLPRTAKYIRTERQC